jgi:hypothetical protein
VSLELQCPQCACGFEVDPETPAGAALDRLTEAGPWSCLGDGETPEDSLSAELDRQELECPACASRIALSEETLSKLALQLLVQW